MAGWRPIWAGLRRKLPRLGPSREVIPCSIGHSPEALFAVLRELRIHDPGVGVEPYGDPNLMFGHFFARACPHIAVDIVESERIATLLDELGNEVEHQIGEREGGGSSGRSSSS